MRLHNRQVKAAFWTDTDLIRLLDIPGRMFYQGLWQLADDSGCLDHDILAFKIHLFPADDISVETIEQWVNKLIEAKKLIPYESEGKKCLFLKNFHKHQTLRNCPPPEVPLPPWVVWEPYPSNEKQGKYIVTCTSLPSSYNKTFVSEPPLQSSYNQNQNLNQNHNQNRNLDIKSDSTNPTPPADPESEKTDVSEEPSEPNCEVLTPQEAVFSHWNSKGIIQHRKLTDKLKRAINGAIRDYTQDEICTAVDNYAVILADDKYYWTHKWTLKEFLERGIDKFLDFDIAAQNYAKENEKARGDPSDGPQSWDPLRELYNEYSEQERSAGL